MDQTVTIRASVHDVECTLLISVLLVVLVVFFFLRNVRTTMIPSVAVPVSLIGTFGVMYLLHFSIDNLSLMALTISTGFVVDDAIVVIENITRYLEQGVHPFQAAIKGAQEIGFTVLSMSLSLIAVFIPLLLMGGIVGRLFREFAITLSVAIAVSLVVSMTTTPDDVRALIERAPGAWLAVQDQRAVLHLDHQHVWQDAHLALNYAPITLAILLATIALNCYLFVRVPKGFFPQQDNGRMVGQITGDQDISFQAMDRIVRQMVDIVDKDPGGGHGERIDWRRRLWRHHQSGAHVHFPETVGGEESAEWIRLSRGCGPNWRAYRAPRCTCRLRKT